MSGPSGKSRPSQSSHTAGGANELGAGMPRFAHYAHPRDIPAEIRTRVLRAVQLGMPVHRAAALARVRPAKLREWMSEGAAIVDGDAMPHQSSNEAFLAAFGQDVAEAEALCELRWHGELARADNPRHIAIAQWQLERRFPDEFGRGGGTVVNTGPVTNIEGVGDSLAVLRSLGVTVPAALVSALGIGADDGASGDGIGDGGAGDAD